MFTDKDLRDGLILAKKYTKSIQDAEDVLSKAALKAIDKHHQCKGKFSAWFRTIVRTTALNHHRTDKPTVPLTSNTDEWLGLVFETYSETPIQKMLDLLTERERDVIISKYFNNESQRSIAKRYKVTAHTIAAWKYAAIQKMQTMLLEEIYDY